MLRKGLPERELRPTPDERGSQEGPVPLLGWGNRGTRRRDDRPEASLRDLRRSGGPEAPVLRLMLRSRLPTPPTLRWRRRASAPHPNSHTPSPGSCSSPQVPRAGSKEYRGAPAAICSQGALGACVPPVQHGGDAAAGPHPPTSLPQAGDFPSRPSSGREDDPNPPDPFSPLPLLANGVTYPT